MSRAESSASSTSASRARSRTAWDGDRDDAMSPTAMESEQFGHRNVSRKVQKRSRTKEVAASDEKETAIVKKEDPRGCWVTFIKGLRSLWATRLTESTSENRELYVKTTLRELLIYAVFLIILCILTFGMTSSQMFYYTKVMSDLFLDSTYFTSTGSANTFRGMNTFYDFWGFAEMSLLDGLYWELWYNGENVSEYGYIYYENKLLGTPRLRQLRVRNDSCIVVDDFKDSIKECYDQYAVANEDHEPFGRKNGSAWTYHTSDELDGTGHKGHVSTYGGGGFIQSLGSTKAVSAEIVNNLKRYRWLDRGTRAVFIDFTVYNANINLFCVIRLVVEYMPTGGAVPSWSFRAVKLLRYVTVSDYFVLACEFIFVLFIIYYIVEEGIEISIHKSDYFKSFWNVLDIIVILISLTCIIFNVYRTLAIKNMLDDLLSRPDEYPDFDFLSYWQMQFNYAVSIAVFFSWVKVFKYISFNKTMAQLSTTLSSCANDLGGFFIMFFIVFFAFAQLGYLLFGSQIYDFSDFWNAMFTLFRIILGDFNFVELRDAHPFLGPAFFLLYVFFVFFVLLNMFLAIINDSYSEVKSDLSQQEDEFQMGDLFKRSYGKMVEKLNFKRDKIIDIQSALQTADIDGDKQLDFNEWRADLKNRGFADTEIEAVFAKYDKDGDRILDEEEQRQMMADLEGQKRSLNQEFDEMQRLGAGVKNGGGGGLEGGAGDSDDDDDSSVRPASRGGGRRRGGGGGGGVSYEEFTVLSRRVDRMEHSIGSIVSKIDAVLVKLETMEKAKQKRREYMGKLIDQIDQSADSEATKREQMERMVREELEKWDGGGAETPGPDSRQPSSSKPRRTPRGY